MVQKGIRASVKDEVEGALGFHVYWGCKQSPTVGLSEVISLIADADKDKSLQSNAGHCVALFVPPGGCSELCSRPTQVNTLRRMIREDAAFQTLSIERRLLELEQQGTIVYTKPDGALPSGARRGGVVGVASGSPG
ncbi:formin-like protein 3 isoform X1 [Lates japonicus]|uniref:Formin-like protein 3 isoform X1 n=1 Tax=Lates japonicus TaxID=270547 RepID=A0AAD3NJM6_LATJO|nr:formin-like protein 3 isoform X1 [Lates japonicus]